MQTTPIHTLLPLLLPNAPGVPDPVAIQALRLAAVQFCERTRCWRHVITRRITRETSCVVAPEYASIHEIESAFHNGRKLTPTQFSQFDEETTLEPGAVATTGPANYITQVAPDEVSVMPFEAGELKLTLFLKPRAVLDLDPDAAYFDEDEGNVVPTFLVVQHAEALVAGALYRILNLPNQKFTNPARGGEYFLTFEQAANSHFARNIRGQHRAAIRIRPDF
jgi:hypothetical protein